MLEDAFSSIYPLMVVKSNKNKTSNETMNKHKIHNFMSALKNSVRVKCFIHNTFVVKIQFWSLICVSNLNFVPKLLIVSTVIRVLKMLKYDPYPASPSLCKPQLLT